MVSIADGIITDHVTRIIVIPLEVRWKLYDSYWL